MPKESGVGDSLYVAQFDLSGDVGSVSTLSSRRATLDVPGLSDTAMSRIMGIADGEISFNSWWNTAADASHLALSTQLTSDRITSYGHGSVVGNAAASLVGKQMNYDQARGQDGSLASSVQMLANGTPLEWGEMLTTGKQSFGTGTVSGTSINLGAASTAFGAAAYLHVFSVASGTATFAVQDSANDSTFADVTGLVFTGATGPTSERKQTAALATIRQYIRVQGTGVHGAAVVFVNFVRYLTDPAL